ncbi:MAG: Cell division protein SepF [Actinomycetota bacterium]|jgi:cell division inhibitor SepF
MANPFKKTMAFLGLAEEDETYAPEPVAPVRSSNDANTPRAQVTPLRRHTGRNAAATDLNEIVTIQPKEYADARGVAENFREGVPVIINLGQMTDTDARRLIDFASGLVQGLHGKIERVTSKVFLLSPAHVSVTGDEAANTAEVDTTFFGE